MEYFSIDSRTIIISELGIPFHIHSVQIPSNAVGIIGDDSSFRKLSETDDFLTRICQQLFGMPNCNVISYSKWKSILDISLDVLKNKKFQEDIMNLYGDPRGKNYYRDRIRNQIESYQKNYHQLNERFCNIQSFIEGIMRNVILNTFTLKEPNNIRSFDYRRPELPNTFSLNMKKHGVDELDHINWLYLSNQLGNPVLQPIKEIYDNLLEYEFPISSSPPIKSITLKTFSGTCYGAAAYIVSKSAVAIGASFQPEIGMICALKDVTSAGLSALVFITIGAIAPVIESYIHRLAVSSKKMIKHNKTK